MRWLMPVAGILFTTAVAEILPGAETPPTSRPAVGVVGKVGVKANPTRVKTLRIDKPGVYDNYLVDAEWVQTDAVHIKADKVTLSNCEIRNGRKDGIEVYASDVLIENCRIHHFLAGTFKEPADAHGITGRPTRLTVRNCEIGFVSGDCLQFDPGRGRWGEVVIENCTLFAAKLEEDGAGFNKGERPGENAVDTKQSASNPRSSMVVRNCLLKGFAKGAQISNAAALNLKNNVKVTLENCIFEDNEIALRLRGPGKDAKYGGAQVSVTDCAFENCDVAIRAEDGIHVPVLRARFGKGVGQKVKEVGKGSAVEMRSSEP